MSFLICKNKGEIVITTIQFTYDKEKNIYCIGFWVGGKFKVRAKGKDRQPILEKFIKELERLEGG